MHLAFRTAVVLSLAAASAQAVPFSSIVSFGDSLSDVGNFRQISFNQFPGGPGYSDGRFSNGPVWVEQLAPQLGLAVPTRSTAGGTDYAYGLATSGTGNTIVSGGFISIAVPNVRTQINGYAAANVSTATQLFTVLGGANDLFAALQSQTATPAERLLVAQQAAANIVAGVGAIYADGGRNVLVANLPDLGNLPRYNQNQNGQKAEATAVTAAFNAALAGGLASLGTTSPGLNLYALDLATLFTQALADPTAFGLTNVTNANYTGDPAYFGNGTNAPGVAGYLFYDDVHPTTKGHSLVAAAALAAVPEPTLVAVVAVALPLLHRRRRTASVPSPGMARRG